MPESIKFYFTEQFKKEETTFPIKKADSQFRIAH